MKRLSLKKYIKQLAPKSKHTWEKVQPIVSIGDNFLSTVCLKCKSFFIKMETHKPNKTVKQRLDYNLSLTELINLNRGT